LTKNLALRTAQPFPTISLVMPKTSAAFPKQVEFHQHAAQHIRAMLRIDDDFLPNSDLTYLAFRVSFQETLERIVLARQVNDANGTFGYLTEVPFLRGVAPHVQLDLLADCWHRHISKRGFEATLIEESIIYAVCETVARIAEDEPTVITHGLITGPRTTRIKVDAFLPGELRNLHLRLANEGDFLLISQFEDMEPDDARELKMQFGLDEPRFEEMFEVLGRWTVEPGMAANLKGLLTEREIVRAGFVISEVLQPRTARD
jgi:hypothetical protein